MKNSSYNNSDFPDFEQFTASFNSHSDNDFSNNSNPFSNIDMNTIIKAKQIIDGMNKNKDNPRSNLLMSLKPYLKPNKKQKLDQYIQLLNMSNIIENINFTGGEKSK